MHIFKKRTFVEAARNYPQHAASIMDMYRFLKNTSFTDSDEFKRKLPTADNFKYKDKCWVINISGNHIRLIAKMQFKSDMLFVVHLTNHTEYDKLNDRYKKGELK
jgi:mRNA interferase HigB